jgi:hypothetical protein
MGIWKYCIKKTDNLNDYQSYFNLAGSDKKDAIHNNKK